MAQQTLSEGSLVGQTLGHYRVVDKIGEGGMAVVYRAHDEHLGCDVAIKALLPGSLGNRRLGWQGRPRPNSSCSGLGQTGTG